MTESEIELYTLAELEKLAFQFLSGPDIAPDGTNPERQDYSTILLIERLKNAAQKLNSAIPLEVINLAISQLQRIHSPELITNNEQFHRYLTDGIPVTWQEKGIEINDYVWLIDFKNSSNNEYLAINQYTIIENNQNKRPDIILFINGIPLVVIELKNAADENATIKKAYEQIQTYKSTIPSLFTYSALCIISDGMECKAGTISSDYSRFMAWNTEDGRKEASRFAPQLETMIHGMLNPDVLLDLIRYFIVFEKDSKTDSKTGLIQVQTIKKLAAYHQYYAVNKAVESTIIAAGFAKKIIENNNFRGGLDFSGLIAEARVLRKEQTPAEEIFWQLVRDRKFLNLKFRRQHQINNYIVDFYCHELHLIIEFDGEIHDAEQQIKHDITRDKLLTSLGNKIIRFKNDDILNSPEKVLENISLSLSLRKELGDGKTSNSNFTKNPSLSHWERLGEGNTGLQRTKLGSKKAGVIWHTQGSGKSLSMVFYSGKLIVSEEMSNPTIVVLTDRNDLDDQLFDTFAASKQLLRQEPVQAENREDLKRLLKVASGGIVFTTIQKFMPEEGKKEYDQLSGRRNIIVIADEAHRTQYGFDAKLLDTKDSETKEIIGKRIAYGFAKYMRDALPNATYIGFTGTPIENTDVNTPAVFGNYIDIYDISQAVTDGATVRIYYESRLAKVNLDEEGKLLIEEFDRELEESDELSEKQKPKAKWSKLEAIIGNKERIKNLAKDIISHYEKRQSVFDGKAMIVAMSRRIAVDLYNEIIAIKPEWHNDDLTKGTIKVVMTASSADGPVMQKHHTTKSQRKMLSDRMKEPSDSLKIVIVRDMWLTGFDAPCLHTLYIDKPMRGHNLMQAIARVNRVFKDKPGGLVVDYLGIASDLKKALSFYSDSGGKGDATLDQEKAVELLLEKLEVVRQLFAETSKSYKEILAEEPLAYYANSSGFNYSRFFIAPPREKLSIILQAEEHILGLTDGKTRFVQEVTLLSRAFALSVPHDTAMAIKDEVAFFQAVKARLIKFEITGTGKSFSDFESAIKQIVDQALISDLIIDIFDAAGIKKPEISILSDEFLLEIKGMKHQNLALELLKKLLNDEIKARSKKNFVRSRKLLEMLENSIKKYQNNLLTTAEIIQELINIAKEIKESDNIAKEMNLTEDELAFYDALETNDSAVKVLGDDILRTIAHEIAEKVKANATIDWTIRESARAKLMVLVRRTLNKYGYPPDKQQKAIDTVLKQAELLADLTVN